MKALLIIFKWAGGFATCPLEKPFAKFNFIHMKKLSLLLICFGCFSFALIPPGKKSFTLKKFDLSYQHITVVNPVAVLVKLYGGGSFFNT